jgi:rfaE bifunctional protein kinase chain/domain
MTPDRFQQLLARYQSLRLAVVGDFCLDRYLEIDPARREVSLETSLPVHNVINVRPQPGGAGTIVNNLSALGIGSIHPLGFAGNDGEGFELCEALGRLRGVHMDHFVRTAHRRTFTYCKPLIVSPGHPPRELNRLDFKNWTPTPGAVEDLLIDALRTLAAQVDAVILLDQVDVPETGVVTTRLLAALGELANQCPNKWILADSRRSLRGFPPVIFKMNAAELGALAGAKQRLNLTEISSAAATLAAKNGRFVFVTLSENGILGAAPDGGVKHLPALPLRGEIDIVGAGDAVTANLVAALAAGAILEEALEIANAAASVVIHKLGTTGTASPDEIKTLLFENPRAA